MDFTFERNINYYETDKMGVVHHSNYIRFFEEARCYWLQSIEMPFDLLEDNGITIPVLGVNCTYKYHVTFGDILVVICLYTFSKSIFLDKIKRLSLYVLICAVIVEILQYFNYAQILFGDNKIIKTLLGSSFDIKDILCYVMGYLIIILVERSLNRRKGVEQK